MSDLFSGLEEFGLGGLKNMEVYEKEAEKAANGEPKRHQPAEPDFYLIKPIPVRYAIKNLRQRQFVLEK